VQGEGTALASTRQPPGTVELKMPRLGRRAPQWRRPTDVAATGHGLALALPEKVELARPTGVGRAITAYEIPIEGRDEWLAAARRLA
jgi:hypothetical protein